jgi:hypothetical protein
VPDLPGLDQGHGLEDLVQRPESPGEDDEGIGILDQHHLAHEEVLELQEEVEVGVGPLL